MKKYTTQPICIPNRNDGTLSEPKTRAILTLYVSELRQLQQLISLLPLNELKLLHEYVFRTIRLGVQTKATNESTQTILLPPHIIKTEDLVQLILDLIFESSLLGRYKTTLSRHSVTSYVARLTPKKELSSIPCWYLFFKAKCESKVTDRSSQYLLTRSNDLFSPFFNSLDSTIHKWSDKWSRTARHGIDLTPYIPIFLRGIMLKKHKELELKQRELKGASVRIDDPDVTFIHSFFMILWLMNPKFKSQLLSRCIEFTPTYLRTGSMPIECNRY